MLVLSRKLNESIVIGDNIEIMVLEIRDNFVKLGIKAPRDVSVHRLEVHEEILRENQRASQQPQPSELNRAAEALRKRKKPDAGR